MCRERPAFDKFKVYRGENENDCVIDRFFYTLQRRKKIYTLLVLTKEQMKKHKEKTNCEYCKVEFEE